MLMILLLEGVELFSETGVSYISHLHKHSPPKRIPKLSAFPILSDRI